ncbi:hypothetical protein HME9302_01756 [Alteripontixanthobacter maritimus]|uniref:N-acetyltransferase domain-containing protein n=1 Tax=Alteripontixanthobacter maritimus TaxID=2161824 RepID=A0A369QAJ1_9SPHN|nr:N-acetyltransferase [Alteripontixanthobacter maritimus]RDC60545.1 hypothetical protein HME9302_01756 [Alteripontixanthobacter maritimus]
MPTLVPLDAVEPALIEKLLDAAFGQERHAKTAYRIREQTDWLPGLSFAALDDDDYLAGTIQLWPVALTDKKGRPHPLVMVGPVAVLPALQGEGIGKALMLAALEALGEPAALPQIMIGDPDYYGRFFGFTADYTGDWHCPGPFEHERLLLRTDNPAVLPNHGMLGPWTAETARAKQTSR